MSPELELRGISYTFSKTGGKDLMSRMQRRTALAMSIAETLLATAPPQAQQGGVEIGTDAGLSILRTGGANLTIFGIPSASI